MENTHIIVPLSTLPHRLRVRYMKKRATMQVCKKAPLKLHRRLSAWVTFHWAGVIKWCADSVSTRSNLCKYRMQVHPKEIRFLQQLLCLPRRVIVEMELMHVKVDLKVKRVVHEHCTSCLPFILHTRMSFLLDSHVRFCQRNEPQSQYACYVRGLAFIGACRIFVCTRKWVLPCCRTSHHLPCYPAPLCTSHLYNTHTTNQCPHNSSILTGYDI